MLVQKVRLNNIYKTNSNRVGEYKQSTPLKNDSVKFSGEPRILTKKGKEIRVLSFGGINDPFASHTPTFRFGPQDINRIAVGYLIKSEASKDFKLDFECTKKDNKPAIKIKFPPEKLAVLPFNDLKDFGYASDKVTENFYDDIKENPQDFEISVNRTFKNSKFALLDLKYIGKNEEKAKEFSQKIYNLFNNEEVNFVQEDMNKNKEVVFREKHEPDSYPEPTAKKIRPAQPNESVKRAEETESKYPGIRMGLEDAQDYQANLRDFAKANPKREMKLKFKCIENYNPKCIKRESNKSIEIYYEPQEFGQLGYKEHKVLGHMPKTIVESFYDDIKENPDEYHIILNRAYKRSKSPKNFAMMDFEYIGQDYDKQEVAREKISKLLFKNQVTPEEILQRMLDYKKVINGKIRGNKIIKETNQAISEITKVLQNSQNKKILLIGHDNPDGDTVGSALGLKYALEIYGGKEKIDVGINDVMKGFIRKIPGSENIKRTKEYLEKIDIDKYLEEKKINDIKEYQLLKKTQQNIIENTKLLNDDEKYDVVVMLDIAEPKMMNKSFKRYIENAKKVIYIDHHPESTKNWQKEKEITGFDVDKSIKEHLYWVEKKSPAAATMVTILTTKLLSKLPKVALGWSFDNFYGKENRENLFKMASALATGITTDTSGYQRCMNMQLEDTKVARQDKPNFAPKGMATWLFSLTKGDLTKYKLRKQMDFDLPKKAAFLLRDEHDEFSGLEDPNGFEIDENQLIEDSPYKRIVDLAAKNATNHTDIGLGIVKAKYEDVYDIWKDAGHINDGIILKDVADSLKFNPTVLDFRFPRPWDLPKYRNDKIAVVIRQEGKEGFLNSKYHLSDNNQFTFSFRSMPGTNHANILAMLFNGGGHDAASGGKLELEGLNYDTKLAVKINGEIETNDIRIVNTLRHNYDIERFIQQGEMKEIEIIKAPKGMKGRTIEELLIDTVREIRQK